MIILNVAVFTGSAFSSWYVKFAAGRQSESSINPFSQTYLKGAVSATPLFMFTSGDTNKLNCLKEAKKIYT